MVQENQSSEDDDSTWEWHFTPDYVPPEAQDVEGEESAVDVDTVQSDTSGSVNDHVEIGANGEKVDLILRNYAKGQESAPGDWSDLPVSPSWLKSVRDALSWTQPPAAVPIRSTKQQVLWLLVCSGGCLSEGYTWGPTIVTEYLPLFLEQCCGYTGSVEKLLSDTSSNATAIKEALTTVGFDETGHDLAHVVRLDDARGGIAKFSNE